MMKEHSITLLQKEFEKGTVSVVYRIVINAYLHTVSQIAPHASHVFEARTSSTLLLRGNTSQVLHTALACSVAHCSNIPNEKVAQVIVNAMWEMPKCY